MPETLPDSLPVDAAGAGDAPSRPPSPGPRENRTLAAGRAFLAALGADLAALGRRMVRALASAGRRTTHASASGGRPTRAGALRRVVVGLARGAAVVGVVGALTLAGAMLWALHDIPAEKPVGGSKESSLLLEASNGAPLGRVGPLKMADAARTDFPDTLVKAVVSIEDRRFYSHWGFDPQGMLRALRRNVAAGTVVEGGSTITQQLVKLRILGHERTLPAKLREALTAMWLDMHLGKDAILTRYLNSVYLGNGVYGMAAAARFYFDKRASELTVPEAAMLAGLIRSPSRENPFQNLEAAQARAAVVIDAMRENGAIDAATADDAKAHPASLHLSGQALRAGSWFADWIAKESADLTGAYAGSMRLRTTLVPGLQKLAEQAVGESLDGPGAGRHASQAALVAMRPDGAVVAMVGGRNYQESQFNRAVNAQRQPGSAFKLFVYLAALRKGFSVDDTIDASPLDIKGWQPENYAERQYGRVTLAEAFAQSINTAAVRLAQQVGLNNVVAAARDLGVTGPLPAVPSLALGTADLSLLELTAAFASVQADKMPVKPWGISGLGVEGQPRLQSMGAPIGSTQSLQPYQKPLLDLLQGVIQHGTGRAAALNGFAAGKTGTSQDYRDAWFIGFNDTLIVGVWVGNDDRTPMDRVTGGSLPAAIWKRFMTDATTVAARQEQPAAAPPSPDVVATAPPPARAEPAPAAAERSPETGQCDYQACARTYQSFRASDCTYQPYGSTAREVCDKSPSQRTAAMPYASTSRSRAPLDKSERSDRPSRGQCNIDACAAAYESFDSGDCTYQPYDGGPRRACTK